MRRGLRLLLGAALCLACDSPASAEVQFAFEFGGAGTPPPGQLSPGGVAAPAVDRDGNVWVADAPASRVVKYDYNGRFIAQFRSALGGGRRFRTLWDVAADNAGNIYVLMQSPARVVQMTTRGRFVRTLTVGDPTPLSGVAGLAVDNRSFVYIADGGNRRIVVFNDRGEFRRTIALTYNPGRLAIGPRRSLYVTDPGSDHIRVHSNRGTLVNDVSFPGGARGVAVNLTVTPPLVYLALAGNARVAEYDLAFTPRRFLTQVGQGVGQTVAPEKIAVDCRGSLYITSFGGGGVAGAAGPSKVIKFADPASKPPPCTPAAPLTEPVDAQVNDVEVTQGVQWPRDFTATDSPAGPRTRAYGGPDTEVPLRVDGKTVVRVYANLHSGDLGGVTNVPATLEGVGQFGKRFGPIAPDSVPAVLRLGGTTVDAAQRADEAGAYTFTLPLDWTRAGRLELTARVNPAGLGCDDACVRRSTFKLTGVPFRNTVRGCSVGGTGGRPRPACDNVYGVDIDPVALTSGGRYPQLPNGSTLNDPGPIFDVARALTPAELLVRGWGAEIEIGDLLTASAITTSSCFLGIQLGITCSEDTENLAVGSDRTRELLQPMLLDRVQRYKASRNIGDARIVIGLRGGNERNAVSLPGAMRGKFLEGGFPPIEFVGPRGYVDVSRPYTAVAHELQHALGRPHAGQNCPGTGPGEDQEGEPWPAGNMGNLIGTGLDTRAGSGGFRGPYQIIAPGANGFGNTLFDLMSYCVGAAGETSTWTSPLGWNEILNYKSPPQLLAAARPAQATTDLLAVTAVQLSDGSLHIGGTRPGRGRAPDADPAATYQVEARDQAGNILAGAPANVAPLEGQGAGEALLLTGSVPAPAGTAQLVVRRGTETATRRVRSANAPTVRLLGPRGTVSGRGAAVRWRAADRDGDALTATIEYSRNDGRSWRTVEVGPARGSALMPLRLLGASRRARIRVRVDDGFREAVATSPRLRVAGTPPLVRILDPVRAQRIRADAPLYLRGEAAAEGGAPLPFSALRWFDGRRPLGRGSRFSVSGLRAGRHRIRLVVRRAGRTGTASTLVSVRAVQPAFLRLDPPARLSRRARRVRLRVASTVAADLRVGGRRFRVGPRARTVSVAISPGSSPLRLALRLRAGSLSTTRSLTLARS